MILKKVTAAVMLASFGLVYASNVYALTDAELKSLRGRVTPGRSAQQVLDAADAIHQHIQQRSDALALEVGLATSRSEGPRGDAPAAVAPMASESASPVYQEPKTLPELSASAETNNSGAYAGWTSFPQNLSESGEPSLLGESAGRSPRAQNPMQIAPYILVTTHAEAQGSVQLRPLGQFYDPDNPWYPGDIIKVTLSENGAILQTLDLAITDWDISMGWVPVKFSGLKPETTYGLKALPVRPMGTGSPDKVLGPEKHILFTTKPIPPPPTRVFVDPHATAGDTQADVFVPLTADSRPKEGDILKIAVYKDGNLVQSTQYVLTAADAADPRSLETRNFQFVGLQSGTAYVVRVQPYHILPYGPEQAIGPEKAIVFWTTGIAPTRPDGQITSALVTSASATEVIVTGHIDGWDTPRYLIFTDTLREFETSREVARSWYALNPVTGDFTLHVSPLQGIYSGKYTLYVRLWDNYSNTTSQEIALSFEHWEAMAGPNAVQTTSPQPGISSPPSGNSATDPSTLLRSTASAETGPEPETLPRLTAFTETSENGVYAEWAPSPAERPAPPQEIFMTATPLMVSAPDPTGPIFTEPIMMTAEPSTETIITGSFLGSSLTEEMISRFSAPKTIEQILLERL